MPNRKIRRNKTTPTRQRFRVSRIFSLLFLGAVFILSDCVESGLGGTVATPILSPAGGTYDSAQNVTIACTTSGASIHYTTDGSAPTKSSKAYSSPVAVSATTTLKAIASKSGSNDSAVATASYVINPSTVATPTFSPAEGTYDSAQNVTIACATSGASIFYTTDGSAPTASSTAYVSPVTISATTTLKAIATKSGYPDSVVATATYVISIARSISGKLYDDGSGVGVSGAEVHIGDLTVITASDGSFSLDLESSEAVPVGGFGISKTGYHTDYFDSVSVTPPGNSPIYIPILPNSYSYPPRTVVGTIYEIQTNPQSATEIANGSTFSFQVMNIDKGSFLHLGTYNYNNGFTFNTETYGSDCLIVVTVNPIGKNPFTVMSRHVDLSQASTTLDLTETASNNVTINGVQGDTGILFLSTPYGLVKTWTATMTTASESIQISNPYGYLGIWGQYRSISPFISGYDKYLLSYSSEATIDSVISLPAINPSLGPNAPADAASLSFSNGTLSIDPVNGANLYSFLMSDINNTNKCIEIYSKSPSFRIPSWLLAALSGSTVRVYPEAVNMDFPFEVSELAISLQNSHEIPAYHVGRLFSTGPSNNTKNITF
jgi:hypothetical protein